MSFILNICVIALLIALNLHAFENGNYYLEISRSYKNPVIVPCRKMREDNQHLLMLLLYQELLRFISFTT